MQSSEEWLCSIYDRISSYAILVMHLVPVFGILMHESEKHIHVCIVVPILGIYVL